MVLKNKKLLKQIADDDEDDTIQDDVDTRKDPEPLVSLVDSRDVPRNPDAQCRTCRYYYVKYDKSECRLRPPTSTGGSYGTSVFPSVDSTDWCGCHPSIVVSI